MMDDAQQGTLLIIKAKDSQIVKKRDFNSILKSSAFMTRAEVEVEAKTREVFHVNAQPRSEAFYSHKVAVKPYHLVSICYIHKFYGKKEYDLFDL